MAGLNNLSLRALEIEASGSDPLDTEDLELDVYDEGLAPLSTGAQSMFRELDRALEDDQNPLCQLTTEIPERDEVGVILARGDGGALLVVNTDGEAGIYEEPHGTLRALTPQRLNLFLSTTADEIVERAAAVIERLADVERLSYEDEYDGGRFDATES